jgi:hypothetical protein
MLVIPNAVRDLHFYCVPIVLLESSAILPPKLP